LFVARHQPNYFCGKTLPEVNRDFGALPCPKISVKNYMSEKIIHLAKTKPKNEQSVTP
jgi:hypothetical protein